MKTLARTSDKDEILRRLRKVRPDSRARWGRMSAHEMICHLGDALLMSTGQRRVTLQVSVLKRTVAKWLALWVLVRWPPGIPTSVELDQRRGGTRPGDFAADVARVEALVEAVAAPNRSFESGAHPYFGRMTDAEWLRWGWQHLDHHLRQFGA